MTYSSVIYKLNKRYHHGKNVYEEGPISFPKTMSFEEIIPMIVRGQGVCFKDGNIDDKNGERIYDSFDRYADEQPSVAVIFSLGYLIDDSSLLSASDMGALTIQSGELNIMTDNVLSSRKRGLWINEVCRSLFNKEMVPRSSGPIPNVMRLAEQYALSMKHDKLYLMVEKNPEHGDGNILVQYYGEGYKERGGYGYVIVGEDKDYWYMEKDLSRAAEPDIVVEEVVVIEETPQIERASSPDAVVSPTTTEEGQTLLENLEESLAEAGQVKRKSKTRRRRKSKSKDTRKRKK